MKHLSRTLLCLIFGAASVLAQNEKVQDSVSTENLLEVILTSNRLEISFNEKSKTVQLITADQIQQRRTIPRTACPAPGSHPARSPDSLDRSAAQPR